MRDESNQRAFGHWKPGQQPAKPSLRADDKPSSSDADATRETLETLAQRRKRRDPLVDPDRPAPPPISREPQPVRETLKQLAELRRKMPDGPDLSEPMWNRVVELAKPILKSAADTPPRSPGPPPSGPRRPAPKR